MARHSSSRPVPWLPRPDGFLLHLLGWCEDDLANELWDQHEEREYRLRQAEMEETYLRVTGEWLPFRVARPGLGRFHIVMGMGGWGLPVNLPDGPLYRVEPPEGF